ncbi:hypothetical protein [Halalkalibacter sp. APA_J-10(15)]|uniref:hypothetical protein n=1 Tax=Halalkalibacter sp. APA_J-10(15) TaxID=2933805 RepID=UPI001FF5D474|nr:hypothetical protein [Halalkalibacter sp. APA_J-10(15)]MCK0470870.1 hypothetical protein [Halalkalibacter sp. APA_J-10(15)]
MSKKRFLFLCTPVHLDNIDEIRIFVAENEERCIKEMAAIESVNEFFRETYKPANGDYYELALHLIRSGEWMKLNIRKLAEIETDYEFEVLH